MRVRQGNPKRELFWGILFFVFLLTLFIYYTSGGAPPTPLVDPKIEAEYRKTLNKFCSNHPDETKSPKIHQVKNSFTQPGNLENQTLYDFCSPYLYAQIFVGAASTAETRSSGDCSPQSRTRGKGCTWYHMCIWPPAVDVYVSSFIKQGEIWEPFLVNQMMESISTFQKKHGQQGIVIDAGSNIGQYAVVAASMNQIVYAVDPIPEHVEMVQKSFALNGWSDRLHIFRNALSDYYAATAIQSHKTNKGGATLKNINSSANVPDARFAEDIPLDTIRLDDLLPYMVSRYPQHHVSYWKADIEGYESRMFKGAPLLLAHYQPEAIGFEVLGKAFARTECHGDKLLEGLIDLGYTLTNSKTGLVIPRDQFEVHILHANTFTMDVLATKNPKSAPPKSQNNAVLDDHHH